MKWTIAIVILLCGSAGAAPFADLRRAAAVNGDAAAGAAKVAVCVACHGPQGNAVVPAFPALAGQHAGYLYQSLAGFQRRADPASPMTAQVKDLDDADLRNIAAYFAAQPRQARPATTAAGGAGQALFLAGDPARGIPPCQACHGADGRGHPQRTEQAVYDYYPALAAQQPDYLAARLAQYRDGRLSDSSNALIMRGVAHNLDDASIRALADWLGSLPR
jgi:cytochrome c553